jgi:hypothetical protein
MTEASKTLDNNEFTLDNILLPDGVEDCDSSAENGCVLDWIDICWDADDSLSTE